MEIFYLYDVIGELSAVAHLSSSPMPLSIIEKVQVISYIIQQDRPCFTVISCILVLSHMFSSNGLFSGVASIGARGDRVPPLTVKIVSKKGKNWEKERKIGKNQEKEEKSGRKGQNRDGSFTLPLLTNRAGYATGAIPCEIHIPCGRFTVHIPQGECDFQTDWHIEQLYLKVTHPLGIILLTCIAEAVEMFCGSAQWAIPLENKTPCVKGLWSVFHRARGAHSHT